MNFNLNTHDMAEVRKGDSNEQKKICLGTLLPQHISYCTAQTVHTHIEIWNSKTIFFYNRFFIPYILYARHDHLAHKNLNYFFFT